MSSAILVGGGGGGSQFSAINSTITPTGTYTNYDVSLNNRLFVGGDASFGGNINLATSTAGTGVFINTFLVASGDIFTYGNVVASVNAYATNHITTSDKRIKTNIVPISNSYALDTLRKIDPVKYSLYNNTSNSTFGFIAQDIEKSINQSVSKTTNFIPNIYDYAFVCSGSIIKLQTKRNIYDISFNDSPIKIKFQDDTGHYIIRVIDKIVNENTFTITEPIITPTENKRFFVYGQEVDDFYALNYSTIFTMVTAAVKQIDIEQQELKSIVRQQSTNHTQMFFQEEILASNNVENGLFLKTMVFPNTSHITKTPIIQTIINETSTNFTRTTVQSKINDISISDDYITFNLYMFNSDNSEFNETTPYNVGFVIYAQ